MPFFFPAGTRRFFSAVALFSLFLISSAYAAADPAREIGSESSAFKRRTEAAAVQEAPLPKIELPAEDEKAAPEVASRKFTVREIRLEGVKEISPRARADP